MTWAMADIMAVSVPGRMGIHSSARETALNVMRGSMQTTRAPLARASLRKYSVFVPSRISAGFQLHINIYLELSQSCRWFPVTAVPYTVGVAAEMQAQE